jgi:hypothetical protein
LEKRQQAAAAAAKAATPAQLPTAHMQDTWPEQMKAAARRHDLEPAISMCSDLIKMSGHPAAAAAAGVGCLPAAIKGCEGLLLLMRRKRIQLYQETERWATMDPSVRTDPYPGPVLQAASKRCREKAAMLGDMIEMYEQQLAVLKAKQPV